MNLPLGVVTSNTVKRGARVPSNKEEKETAGGDYHGRGVLAIETRKGKTTKTSSAPTSQAHPFPKSRRTRKASRLQKVQGSALQNRRAALGLAFWLRNHYYFGGKKKGHYTEE